MDPRVPFLAVGALVGGRWGAGGTEMLIEGLGLSAEYEIFESAARARRSEARSAREGRCPLNAPPSRMVAPLRMIAAGRAPSIESMEARLAAAAQDPDALASVEDSWGGVLWWQRPEAAVVVARHRLTEVIAALEAWRLVLASQTWERLCGLRSEGRVRLSGGEAAALAAESVIRWIRAGERIRKADPEASCPPSSYSVCPLCGRRGSDKAALGADARFRSQTATDFIRQIAALARGFVGTAEAPPEWLLEVVRQRRLLADPDLSPAQRTLLDACREDGRAMWAALSLWRLAPDLISGEVADWQPRPAPTPPKSKGGRFRLLDIDTDAQRRLWALRDRLRPLIPEVPPADDCRLALCEPR